MPITEHFAVGPGWAWWIVAYFFVAGIAGGSYAIGTMLRLWGSPRDETAARIAFLISFPAVILCPILLTADLGQQVRFWHMLVDTSSGGLVFKFWSPMSVGSWALLFFGLFSFVSFLAAAAEMRYLRLGITDWVARAHAGALGAAWTVIGMLLGLFVAGYTGVLLAVSNQPVWSDAWALGGLFLASALSGSAALVLLLARSRAPAATEAALADADRWFSVIEAVLIVVFVVTVAASGVLTRMLGPWLLLWLLVVIGLVASIASDRWSGFRRGATTALAPLLGLLGVLALRALVIFSAQL